LLQPCPFTSTYVARRAQHQEEVDVPQGSTVLWRFSVGEGLDIQFSAVFTPQKPTADGGSDGSGSGGTASAEEAEKHGGEGGGGRMVLMEGRLPAAASEKGKESGAVSMVQGGSYTAPVAGSCVLMWDNAYSRLRGKQVSGAGD
jgi:hypothetical protein